VLNSALSVTCKLAESRRRGREVEGFVDILGSTSVVGGGKRNFRARRSSSAGRSQVRALTKRVHEAAGASRKKVWGNLVQSAANARGARCDYFLLARATSAERVESEGVRYVGGGRLSARTSTPDGKLPDAAISPHSKKPRTILHQRGLSPMVRVQVVMQTTRALS